MKRITISLDSLDPERFALLTGRNELTQVLDGIDAAIEAGLHPVKVNCVVIRGINDDQAVDFARFARERGVQTRFIEFMPLDNGKVWRREMVVPGDTLRERINEVFPLIPVTEDLPAKPRDAGDLPMESRVKWDSLIPSRNRSAVIAAGFD